MITAIDDKPHISTLGRILVGADAGWFIYIKAKRGGYVTYRNAADDLAGGLTWYTWHSSFEALRRHFAAEGWRIEWVSQVAVDVAHLDNIM